MPDENESLTEDKNLIGNRLAARMERTTSSGPSGERKSGLPAESITSITSHRRKRLVRSENVSCCHHQSGWEAIFRESLLHMAWPISLSMSTDNENDIMDDFLPLKIRLVLHYLLYQSGSNSLSVPETEMLPDNPRPAGQGRDYWCM